MQESELWLDQDEWAILLELLSEAVKAIWVKLEPEWEDDQTTGSVGVATKLRVSSSLFLRREISCR